MKKFLLGLTMSLALFSCSQDDSNTATTTAQQSETEVSNSARLTPGRPKNHVCTASWPGMTGDYGCGFREGHDLYQDRYNELKTALNLPDCVRYRTTYSESGVSVWIYASVGYIIPVQLKQSLKSDFDFLYARKDMDQYYAGKFAAFTAMWSQEPYTTAPNCNDQTPANWYMG